MGPRMWRCPACGARFPQKVSGAHYAACKKRRQQKILAKKRKRARAWFY